MEAMLTFNKQLKYLKMFCDINDIILIIIKIDTNNGCVYSPTSLAIRLAITSFSDVLFHHCSQFLYRIIYLDNPERLTWPSFVQSKDSC